MTENQIAAEFFLPLCGMVAVTMTLGTLINYRLRKHHVEVWKELGSPRFGNRSISTSLAEAKFVYFWQFKKIDDGALNRLGIAAAVANYITLSYFLFLLWASSSDSFVRFIR